MTKMSKKQHKDIHIELHKRFDELLADFIYHTDGLPSETTLAQFMQWSHEQTIKPTEKD